MDTYDDFAVDLGAAVDFNKSINGSIVEDARVAGYRHFSANNCCIGNNGMLGDQGMALDEGIICN